MAKYVLQIVEGPQAGTRQDLASDLTIGRRAGCDLVIEGDEKISGRHCEVVLEGEGVLLRDLESTNGTRVDGKRIQEIPIAHGDRFHVGKTVVQLLDLEKGEVVDEPAGAIGIDAEMLARSRKRSPVALISLLGLLLAGAAAWWFFFLRADAPQNRTKAQKVERIAGNLLSEPLSQLEGGDDEWLPLAAGGGTFTRGGGAKTGRGALVADLGGEAESVDPAEVAAVSLFAVAMQPQPVAIGRKTGFTARAAFRGDGRVRVGLRLCFFGPAPVRTDEEIEALEDEGAPRFTREPLVVVGPALAQADGEAWQDFEVQAAVPAGAVEVGVAIVAVLPAGESSDVRVRVDEVALLENADAAGLTSQIAGTSILALQTAGLVRVQVGTQVLMSATSGLPKPGTDAPLEALARVLSVPCSDVATMRGMTVEDGVAKLEFEPSDGRLALHVPRDVAVAYRVRSGADDLYEQHAGPGQFKGVTGLLWGSDAQPLLFETGAASDLAVTQKADSLHFVFDFPRSAKLRLNFEQERLETLRLARAADTARSEGRTVDALRAYRAVLRQKPFDEGAVREARMARANMLSDARAQLEALERDFDEAQAFEYDGLFANLLQRADALDAMQDEFKEPIATFRKKVRARLERVQQARGRRRAASLGKLAEALEAADQKRLSALVKEFVEKKLPAADEGNGDRD